MTKKETKTAILTMLDQGESKSKTFASFTGKDLKDRAIAHLIASHANPALLSKHAKLIDAMIVISWLQLTVGVLLSLALFSNMGMTAGIIFTLFVAGFCYLFVWGFSHSKAWAYNATILLTLINLPKSLNGFSEDPISTLIGLLVGVSLFSFTWFVRNKIFPDFLVFGPRKIKGQFVLTS